MSKLIIIRGLPGSGKSTLAKKFFVENNILTVEADMFHMKNGVYMFDKDRLHDAHQWCFSRVRAILEEGHNVSVSNTFTTIKELKPYFELSKELGIIPQVIVCSNNFGSIHNVPEETMQKMKNRFQYDITSLFDYLKNVEVPCEASV